MTDVDVRDLEPGDKVLWGDRKEPLEVTDDPVEMNSAADLEAVMVKSNRGTTYVIHEAVIGTPKVKRKTTMSKENPSGFTADGKGHDLRRVD